MVAMGPCSAAVIALTMVVVVNSCVQLVTAAPAYTPRPRQEPPCTHTTHATLCWTVQLRTPLHFHLPPLDFDLPPLPFDLPPQSSAAVPQKPAADSLVGYHHATSLDHSHHHRQLLNLTDSVLRFLPMNRSSLSHEEAGEFGSRSRSEASMVQPSGSGVSLRTAQSQKQSVADSGNRAKSMQFKENGVSKNTSMLSPSQTMTSTSVKRSTTTLESKQQEKMIKEASVDKEMPDVSKEMPDVGKETLAADAIFASHLNGAPQASSDVHRMEIPQQQKEYVYHQMALLVADEVGLSLLGKVGELYDHFVLCYEGEGAASTEKRSRQSSPQAFKESGKAFQLYHKAHAELSKSDTLTFQQIRREAERALHGHQDVAWFTMETVHRRQKRSIVFNDPAFPSQWHLVNHVEIGMDINITGVWEQGVTGKGVTVAVVDDGLEWNNPDLHDNYNFKGSWDLNDNDPDPMPNGAKVSNHHGTRCAGEIAAVANNKFCGVGVAYGAKVSGIRVLDGPLTDSLEAEAFNKKFDINAVYSCSWGPDDDGKTVDGPHILAAKAMKYGIEFGRHGYGSIFVVASGNGGSKQDNCNYDGYANSIYTVTIGAVDESGAMPYYAEECASMLGVTFSSGIASKRDIVTTDWRQKGSTGCTDRHTGTSASAPLAAGIIALMLEAQPCLTWRDVQYIIIITSVKVDRDLAHWQNNGAGLAHSHKHGFGLISAWRMVNAARVWRSVPWMTSYSEEETGGWTVPRGSEGPLVVTHTVTLKDMAGYSLYMLEYVQLTLTLSHPFRGKLAIGLNCPSGTHSLIGAPRPHDNSTEGFKDWTFTTVRCWGEAPTGEWTLTVTDSVPADSPLPTGRLSKWRLTLFGTPMTTHEFHERRKEVERAMSGGYLNTNFTPPCDPPPVTTPPYIPFSEKTLKIVLLAGVFCVVFALYETLEYMLCYGEEKRQQAEDDARRASTRQPANAGPETACLLNGHDRQEDSDWLRLSQTAFHEGDDEEDDMFLLDSGIATQRAQQPCSLGRHGVLGGGAPAGGERIPMSTFRTRPGQAAGNRNIGESFSETLPSNSAERQFGSGASRSTPGVPNSSESQGASSVSHDHVQTAAKSSHPSGKSAKQTLAKNSALPDMWKGLTADRGSDSDSQDEVFSREVDSSVSLLHKNVRKSYR